jgi:hypothetical protein
MGALSDAYVREARAERVDDAQGTIAQELRTVITVFDRIGDYLDVIEATNQRLERRISNTLRFMDRIAETRTERVIEALEQIGSLAGEPSIELDLPHNLAPDESAIGREDLYQYKRTKDPIKPQKIRRQTPDPAFLAYRSAIDAYRARTMVTATKMAAYLETALGDRREARAAELRLSSLDDFFVFERLRSLPQLDEGKLSARYQIELLPGIFESEWIACPDFRVRRTQGASSHAGA